MAVGWEGKKIRLVPLDKEKHFENSLKWVNDPELTEWTLIGDLPLGRLVEEEFFDRVMRQNWKECNEVHFAMETLEGEHIGHTGLHMIEWRHGTAGSGMMIGPAEYRGKGFGSDAIRVRTQYAFQRLNLRLLMSETLSDNIASIRMLEKAGYGRTGCIPKRYWKNGAYRDAILFALHR